MLHVEILSNVDLIPFKENIYITGNLDVLQNWSPDNALLLNATNYPIWSSECTKIFSPYSMS